MVMKKTAERLYLHLPLYSRNQDIPLFLNFMIVHLFLLNFYWNFNKILLDGDEQDFACICHHTQTSHSAAFPGDANGAAITKTPHFHLTKINLLIFWDKCKDNAKKREICKDKSAAITKTSNIHPTKIFLPPETVFRCNDIFNAEPFNRCVLSHMVRWPYGHRLTDVIENKKRRYLCKSR